MLARFVAKDGNIRLVYKDLPILGPASELGSQALLAAARQGSLLAREFFLWTLIAAVTAAELALVYWLLR